MAISTVTVADSISKLSVSGVTIKDLDEIPNGVLSRDCPLILPAPDFIQVAEVERDTFGSGSGAKWTFSYALNYRLFYKPVGTERNIGVIYPELVTKSMLFVDAVIANDDLTGATDTNFGSVSGFGIVPDPDDSLFWGCDIQINITEFVN